MPAVKKFSDFDADSVVEKGVRRLDTGGKIIWLGHGSDQQPIVLQTASLRSPGGVRCWEQKNPDGTPSGDLPPKYNLELELAEGSEEYSKLAAFDENILKLAAASKSSWLNKTHTPDVLRALYTPALRVPIDEATGQKSDRWPVTMKMTVPHRDGEFTATAWDMKRNSLDMREIIEKNSLRGAQIVAIVQCTGVWVAGGKFGTTWKLLQLMTQPVANSIPDFAFLSIEGGEDSEAEAGAPAPAPASPAKPSDGNNSEEDYIDDSD